MQLDDDQAEAAIVRAIDRLPRRVRLGVHSLRRPQGRWVRRPAAVLFVAGGVLGFLPILGFWMIPVGLALAADDIKPLKRWLAGAAVKIENRRDRQRKPRD